LFSYQFYNVYFVWYGIYLRDCHRRFTLKITIFPFYEGT